MKYRLYIIKGGLSADTPQTTSVPRKKNAEPDFDMLNRSPCLSCELFARGRACALANGCSKIEAYQRVAAAYRSLYRPVDIRSMG